MNNIRIVSVGYLSGTDKFVMCPYCVKELEIEGRNYLEILKPLKWVKTAEKVQIGKDLYKEYFDTHYECLRCGNQKINADTFSSIYGDKNSVLRAKGVRFEDTSTVWSEEKKELVDARWDNNLHKYVEISQNDTKEVLTVN